MTIEIKQVSSLDKIRNFSEAKTLMDKKTVLKGEVFSFQQTLFCKECCALTVKLESKLSDYISVYIVKNTAMDFPDFEPSPDNDFIDTDFITKEPGLMPDLLKPISFQNNTIRLQNCVATLWIEVEIPENLTAGKYDITLNYDGIIYSDNSEVSVSKTFTVEVINAVMPKQELKVTQWFHVDCIADVHNVSIYSEDHWNLIDKYMCEAKKQGINMILTPVITPPLDTGVGALRPNVQLVKITKNGENYDFDFSLLKRYIDMAKKNGLEYFEISHLFSQWGLKYSPNIYITENGKEERLFGWHVEAKEESYKNFLCRFIPSLADFLKKENVYEYCYFHISDEPVSAHMDAYRYAYELVAPMLPGAKIMDALSSIEFYESGLVKTPVTAIDHIEPFLEKKIDDQWAYYCCGQNKKVSNRFLSMPSHRNKIIGLQLYKYGIKGFLQWGFNFYYSRCSLYKVNPYVTTSSDMAFPSGDPFSVYPGENGPLPSLRAKVFKEAIQFVSLLQKLESYIGKEKTVELIEKKANMEITFSEYPRCPEFLNELEEEIKEEIKKHS
ncbi:MAG: DUF4091 domain-containing protein [Clostridia bacterium]|nr:DUF4091 domain-containing protein [Clostridia bacterium]